MRVSALKYTILSWVCTLAMLIIFLVPFQGLLTVWGAHLIGHYTALRLWDEVLLLLCAVGVLYLFIFDQKTRFNTLSRRLVWLILIYVALTVVWGLIAYAGHDVTAKALGYGLIVNLRYPIFFLITWSSGIRMTKLRTNWQKLVILPAVIVILFGLLQVFVLPHDFLKHFGYGPNTIPVIETINNNAKYIRIGSTLRGANPLGAYLIIPISLVTIMLSKPGNRLKKSLFLLCAFIVLFYTFSRSAWIGTIVSLITLGLTYKMKAEHKKLVFGLAGSIVAIAIVIALGFHNNVKFQNFVFHTQANSTVKTTSDQGHLSGIKTGLSNIVHSPLGRGPGTAGPASIYNDNKARISENYFIEIGQEVGWLGLILFILINVGVGYLLWLRRDDPLALSLFASLIGITIVNMLLYAWSDDTLALIWWGLAGLAMAPYPHKKQEISASSE
jgi:hypothetical protein